jgi:type IV pilus assembly protein PilB
VRRFNYEAVGCEQCYFTGYSGKAIYEILPIDTELSGLIKNNQLILLTTFEEKEICIEKNAYH